MKAAFLGVDHCSKEHKCGDAEGDCDSNDHCKEGLVCFHRHRGEHLKGYDFGNVGLKSDFCVKKNVFDNSIHGPTCQQCDIHHAHCPLNDDGKRHCVCDKDYEGDGKTCIKPKPFDCEKMVTNVYHTTLCREPDEGGLNYWVGHCIDHKFTDATATTDMFKNTDEYKNCKKCQNDCTTPGPKTLRECSKDYHYEDLFVSVMCEDPNGRETDQLWAWCVEGKSDEWIKEKLRETEDYKNCAKCHNRCIPPRPSSSSEEEENPYHPFDGHGDNPFEFCKYAEDDEECVGEYEYDCHLINGKCEALPQNCYLANNKEMCEWYPNTCVADNGCKPKPKSMSLKIPTAKLS